MSNPLEFPLALCRGKHKNPSQSLEGGQEQSPILATTPSLLQVIKMAATTKSNKNPAAQTISKCH
jgi:hypothetical protein